MPFVVDSSIIERGLVVMLRDDAARPRRRRSTHALLGTLMEGMPRAADDCSDHRAQANADGTISPSALIDPHADTRSDAAVQSRAATQPGAVTRSDVVIESDAAVQSRTATRSAALAAPGAAAESDAVTRSDAMAESDAVAESFAAAFAGDLEVFEAGERLKAEVEDHQLSALARMYAAAEGELRARQQQSWVGRTPFTAREAVVMEVATATGLGEADVAARLDLATGPVKRVGFLREQVRSGATTLRRACLLLSETSGLDDDAVDQVVRAVLAPTRDGAGLTNTLFRSRLRRARVAAGAEGREARRRARERIGVFGQVFDDGTGSLTVINDAEKIAAALDRADAAARAARGAGDDRPLDVLRADFLTNAAINGWPSSDPGFPVKPAPPGRVFVVVPWATAAGLDDAPCELPGHGWVSAEHARELITAPGSIWQTLLADASTGRAVALSTKAYRPTQAIIDHVRAVDGTCRGPGCEIPARQAPGTPPGPNGRLVDRGARRRRHADLAHRRRPHVRHPPQGLARRQPTSDRRRAGCLSSRRPCTSTGPSTSARPRSRTHPRPGGTRPATVLTAPGPAAYARGVSCARQTHRTATSGCREPGWAAYIVAAS
jgi:hypothetical protein